MTVSDIDRRNTLRREISCLEGVRLALKFVTRLGSSVAEVPAKFKAIPTF